MSIGVLLIDFNNSSRAFFNTVLSKTGDFNVWTVASLEEALDVLPAIEESQIHFILLDLSFVSEKTDTVLVQKIVSQPAVYDADLVLLSDDLGESERRLFAEIGIKHVMPKRMGGGSLVKELRNFYAEWISHREEREKLARLGKAIMEPDLIGVESLMSDPEMTRKVNEDFENAHLMGEFLLLQKKPEQAIAHLRSAIKAREKIGEAATLRCLSTLGKALCFMGKYSESLKIFEMLAEKSPLNLMHSIFVGESLLGEKKFSDAAKRFSSVLEVDADNRDARIGLGKASLAMGNVEKALEELSHVKGDVESHSLVSYFNNAGVALIHGGKLQEALAFLNRSIPFFSNYLFVIQFNIGMIYLRLKQPDLAAHFFELAIAGDKDALLQNKRILKAFRELGAVEFVNRSRAGTLCEHWNSECLAEETLAS